MNRLLYLAVLFSFFSGSYAQLITPTIIAPSQTLGTNHGPTNGGEDYPIIFRVTATTVTFNCTINFSHLTRITRLNDSLPNCADPGTGAFTSLTCTDITAGNSTMFTLFQGNAAIQDICSGQTYSVTMICGTTEASQKPQFNITTGSTVLTAELSHDAVNGNAGNLTNVPIVDWLANPKYHLTAFVNNTGCSEAQNVKCTITIPGPLTTPASSGIIEYIASESINTSSCRQLVSNFDCPTPVSQPNGLTLPAGQSLYYQWSLELTGNGTLSSSISCTASRLGSGTVTASLEAYGINFFINETATEAPPGFESDNTDDLVINTIIPLSVFGGIMIFLLVVGIVTVGVYIFVKKVILSEENVGF